MLAVSTTAAGTTVPTFAALLALGISAQWCAWRLKVPSIVLLLGLGILVGPVAGWVDPDALLGDLLLPGVSLAVAAILYEGGLTLRLDELQHTRRMLTRLLTVGVAITFAGASVAAHWLLGAPWRIALLIGAILTVTGPTVIGPLLRHVRPTGRSGALLQWEGIVVDPIGAILAVLVFEAVAPGHAETDVLGILTVLGKTALVGGLGGVAASALLVWLLGRRLVPNYLQPSVSLAVGIGAFAACNHLQHESGLLAVTILGIALANQQRFSIRPILEFKEHLRVILISTLFLVLAARLRLDDLHAVALPGVAFVAALVLVVRPLAVFTSAIGTRMPYRDLTFVAGVAPRGIVAASVASMFALRLQEAEDPAAGLLVPAIFTVIIGTVLIYGFAAKPLASRLGLAQDHAQGVLMIGAHQVARELALAIKAAGQRVVLLDTNRAYVQAARMTQLDAHVGNALERDVLDRVDLGGIGRMLALTPNDEVNTLAAMRYAELFGRDEVYQVAPTPTVSRKSAAVAADMTARVLFTPRANIDELEMRLAGGSKIKSTPLTTKFGMSDWVALYGESAIPLFVQRGQDLLVYATSATPQPRPGDVVIGLVDAKSPAA